MAESSPISINVKKYSPEVFIKLLHLVVISN